MPVKVIEKRLVLACICFVTAVAVVLNIFPSAPVHVSEKSIAVISAAVILAAAGVYLLKRSVVKN